jgi:hypothetical protein
MRLSWGVIGLALLAIGMYFFPLGEDVMFYHLLAYAGGDYWTARAMQYAIFGAAMAAGFVMLRFRTREAVYTGLLVITFVLWLIMGALS